MSDLVNANFAIQQSELFNCNRDSSGVRWQDALEHAILLYLDQTVVKYKTLDLGHILNTPSRVVKAFEAYSAGCGQDPREHLQSALFSNKKYNQMIHTRCVRLVSLCAHHLAPIFGKVHFAYIPNEKIVGLSKIPRFIRVLSRRPQVQENLSDQIVDFFEEVVQPKGCAVSISAFHGCMMLRGVEEPMSFTGTTSLRGVFESQEATRLEFLGAVNHKDQIFP